MTLAARLHDLKATGVPWETAWTLATHGNRRDHFTPTALDDGTTHPCGADANRPHPCGASHRETVARFEYRVLRASYTGEGRVFALSNDMEMAA